MWPRTSIYSMLKLYIRLTLWGSSMRLFLISIGNLQKQRNTLPVTLGGWGIDSLAPLIFGFFFLKCTHFQSRTHSTHRVFQKKLTPASSRGQPQQLSQNSTLPSTVISLKPESQYNV